MAKEDLDFSVIQNVDWDPFEILHQNDGKITDENYKVPEHLQNPEQDGNEESKGDDNPDDNQQQQRQKPQRKAVNQPAPARKGPDFSGIDLTDEQFEEGLANARNRTSGVKQPAQNTNPAGSTGVKQQPEQNPQQPGPKRTNSQQQAPAQQVDNSTVFALHYNQMVQAGEWEPLEDFDGTEASYIKAREYNQQLFRDRGIDEFIDDAFQNNPDGKVMGKKLLQHLANGGRLSDFQTLYAPAELDFKALDDENDEVATSAAQEILQRYYSSIGWKPDVINRKMQQLTKIDGVLDEARLIAPTFQENIEARAAQHQQRLQDQKNSTQQSVQTTNNALLGMINKGHSFGALQVGKDKKEKTDYQNYMFTPTEQGASAFGLELNEALKDPEFLLYLAASLKNKLHKNPEALNDPKRSQQQATENLEKQLSKALLNNSLNSNRASHVPADSGGGNPSKYEFSLDEAIPIHIQ